MMVVSKRGYACVGGGRWGWCSGDGGRVTDEGGGGADPKYKLNQRTPHPTAPVPRSPFYIMPRNGWRCLPEEEAPHDPEAHRINF